MNLRIENALTKGEWIEKLSAFLHDSSVPEQPSYDKLTKRFTLNIRRIGYEYRKEQRLLFKRIRKWRLPRVPTALIVAGVEEATFDGDFPDNSAGADELNEIALDTEKSSLEIVGMFGSVVLQLSQSSYIEVADTGEPDEKDTVHDIGGLIISVELIEEVVSHWTA